MHFRRMESRVYCFNNDTVLTPPPPKPFFIFLFKVQDAVSALGICACSLEGKHGKCTVLLTELKSSGLRVVEVDLAQGRGIELHILFS